VLERGEERVELGERGAVGGFQFIDGGNTTDKLMLKSEWRHWNLKASNLLEIQSRFRLSILCLRNLALATRFEAQKERKEERIDTAAIWTQDRDVLTDIGSFQFDRKWGNATNSRASDGEQDVACLSSCSASLGIVRGCDIRDVFVPDVIHLHVQRANESATGLRVILGPSAPATRHKQQVVSEGFRLRLIRVCRCVAEEV
jgi:hypothetical protein